MKKYYTFVKEPLNQVWEMPSFYSGEAYAIIAKNRKDLFSFFFNNISKEIILSGTSDPCYIFGTEVEGSSVEDVRTATGSWLSDPLVYTKASLNLLAGNCVVTAIVGMAVSCPALVITRNDIAPFLSLGLNTHEITFFKRQRPVTKLRKMELTRSPIVVAHIGYALSTLAFSTNPLSYWSNSDAGNRDPADLFKHHMEAFEKLENERVLAQKG